MGSLLLTQTLFVSQILTLYCVQDTVTMQPLLSLPIFILLLLGLGDTVDSCECTGDGNGDHYPPCGTDYGSGLQGEGIHRKWCYVTGDGSCSDQMNALKTPRFWSHEACYDIAYAFGGADRVNVRYGGGGSGSWKRPGRNGRWNLSY